MTTATIPRAVLRPALYRRALGARRQRRDDRGHLPGHRGGDCHRARRLSRRHGCRGCGRARGFRPRPWRWMSPAERAGTCAGSPTEFRKRVPEMARASPPRSALRPLFPRPSMPAAVVIWNDAAALHETRPFEERRTWNTLGPQRRSSSANPSASSARSSRGTGRWPSRRSSSLRRSPRDAPWYSSPRPRVRSAPSLAEALEAADLAGGVISRVARRPGGRRAPRSPPRSGQDLLYRFDRGRSADHGPLRRADRPGHARTRREVAGIVCDDIPLEQVLPTLLPGGFAHSGQVCAAHHPAAGVTQAPR